MAQKNNIEAIDALKPDFLGFIFYPPSPRFVGKEASFSPEILTSLQAQKVGVFVNETIENILAYTTKYQLDAIQLHGQEDLAYLQKLKQQIHSSAPLPPFHPSTLSPFHPSTLPPFHPSPLLIKAFSVDSNFDFDSLEHFVGICDYFLFDTKGEKHGGNGIKFNWDILARYTLPTPFLLSGGIKPEDAEALVNLKHHALAGIDINSGFEIQPALKNVEAIQHFLQSFYE
jgi:phosphoribosylanthranilate isomerase